LLFLSSVFKGNRGFTAVRCYKAARVFDEANEFGRTCK